LDEAAGGVIEAVKQRAQAKEAQDDNDDRGPIGSAGRQASKRGSGREDIKRKQRNREECGREIGRTQMATLKRHGISPRNSLEMKARPLSLPRP
jgi:hypothetical protein